MTAAQEVEVVRVLTRDVLNPNLPPQDSAEAVRNVRERSVLPTFAKIAAGKRFRQRRVGDLIPWEALAICRLVA